MSEVSEVTRQLIERDQLGRKKYGVTLDRTDLSHGEWLQHMAEELMDGAGYALAAKREYERGYVPRDVLLGWRQDWLNERDYDDGSDIVTPFDAYLYFDQPSIGAAPPMSPAGYRVQGIGVDHATGGFASIKIDGATFDAQLVARTMMRQADAGMTSCRVPHSKHQACCNCDDPAVTDVSTLDFPGVLWVKVDDQTVWQADRINCNGGKPCDGPGGWCVGVCQKGSAASQPQQAVDDARLERAAKAMFYFSSGALMEDDDEEKVYWMTLAKISAEAFK